MSSNRPSSRAFRSTPRTPRPKRSFAAIAKLFPRETCGAAFPLCGAAAGNRPPGGFGAFGDQPAGADARTAISSPATPRSSATRPPTSATTRRSFRSAAALAERALTALERSARDLGFQLVETVGDVVLVTSGAGLAMMMMDLLADHGLARRELHGQSARRARRDHDRAAANRPRARRAAEYQGDRIPDRDRLALARRARSTRSSPGSPPSRCRSRYSSGSPPATPQPAR